MKVLLGLSGGVDSSAAAALLKEAGHDVTAFTLLLGHAEPDGVHRCCSPSDIRDARTVASVLGIPHYVWDFKEMFAEQVMKPFLAGYDAGWTPNPCGMCNRSVRFGTVLDRAIRLGFDALATGHYARSDAGGLFRALDTAKDQSYFLSRISPDAVARLVFPLAHLTKHRVRRIVADMGLPTSDKAESQEICFVGGRTADFLTSRLGARPGEIVDSAGAVLGTHAGVHRYTIGQRRGLGVSSREPLYVIRLEAAANRVVVGGREEACRARVRISDVNRFIDGFEDTYRSSPALLSAQFRHGAAPIRVSSLVTNGSGIDISLAAPAFAPAPGQIAALYDGDRVVASGLIAA